MMVFHDEAVSMLRLSHAEKSELLSQEQQEGLESFTGTYYYHTFIGLLWGSN